MYSWIIWAIITLVALLIEILTLGLIVICFALGALAACLAAFVGCGLGWQLTIFSLTTILALVVARPLVIRYLARSKADIKTNADTLVGRSAIVIEPIENGEGRIRVDRDDWRAEVEDIGQVIAVGESVDIVRVEGVILIVRRR